MIGIYCRGNHHFSGTDLCPQCNDLADYASKRLDSCRFGNKKGSCRKCRIHCYHPFYKENIKKVMRYSGPRMMVRHPIAALRHLWNEFIK